jgi:hypothetical protein
MNHHLLAKIATDSILKKFKTGDWQCCGAGRNFYRVGCDSPFPSPDATFYDDEQKLTVCFEFKPITENKRGILTGLGQAIAYLKTSNVSFLIIPKNIENFDMQEYMEDLYAHKIRERIPVGLISYDNNDASNVSLIHSINSLDAEQKAEFKHSVNNRFWAKHQDLPLPLFHLILHCYYLKRIEEINGDAFAYCWNKFLVPENAIENLTAAEVKDFQGDYIRTLSGVKNIRFLEKKMKKVRQLSGSAREAGMESLKKDADTGFTGDNYYNSIRKNFVTFLKHLNMIDSNGNITESGFKLYNLGLMNGPRSKIFEDYFLQTILTTGHHLDLIFDLDNLCNKYRGKKNIRQIKEIMVDDYESRGMIKRNPRRIAGDESTVEFLKYESILWNSLKLTTKTSGDPNIAFNWKKIVEVCSLPEL